MLNLFDSVVLLSFHIYFLKQKTGEMKE